MQVSLRAFTVRLLSNISRSRALQISINLTALEEWIDDMGLPAGVQVHFAPVRDLLNWLQVRYDISSL